MFSNGEDIEPIDGRVSCSCMVLDGSSDTHWAISLVVDYVFSR